MLSECNFKKTKARRNYKCFICGRIIQKGEYYIAEIAETPNRRFFGGYNPIGPNFYCYARICLIPKKNITSTDQNILEMHFPSDARNSET